MDSYKRGRGCGIWAHVFCAYCIFSTIWINPHQRSNQKIYILYKQTIQPLVLLYVIVKFMPCCISALGWIYYSMYVFYWKPEMISWRVGTFLEWPAWISTSCMNAVVPFNIFKIKIQLPHNVSLLLMYYGGDISNFLVPHFHWLYKEKYTHLFPIGVQHRHVLYIPLDNVLIPLSWSVNTNIGPSCCQW